MFLTLDELMVNLELARRLPPSLAFRYHALPVARDRQRITVALAHPEDQAAREAIANALEAELYVVQSDTALIDHLLAEVWPEVNLAAPRLLLCDHGCACADLVRPYAAYLADTLGGQLADFVPPAGGEPWLPDLLTAAGEGCDLVVWGEPEQPCLNRLLSGPATRRFIERAPTSVLVARRPRWPISRILLVTRGQAANDDPAVTWTIRVAQAVQAAVTVLAVVPATAGMYQRAMSQMPLGLTDWLTSGTPLGQQLSRLAQRLDNWEVQGRLHFRQGRPEQQVKREVEQVDYDLLVIAAESAKWWERRLLGELVNPLISWLDRPLLVARAEAQAGEQSRRGAGSKVANSLTR